MNGLWGPENPLHFCLFSRLGRMMHRKLGIALALILASATRCASHTTAFSMRLSHVPSLAGSSFNCALLPCPSSSSRRLPGSKISKVSPSRRPALFQSCRTSMLIEGSLVEIVDSSVIKVSLPHTRTHARTHTHTHTHTHTTHL